MEIYSLIFYCFSLFLLLSGLMVVAARNPVHSVLWLILAFFCASGLFLMLGAEFLAMVLVVVYVGALAVMFLFVVMMLNIDVEIVKKHVNKLWSLCTLIVAVFIGDVYLIYNKSLLKHHFYNNLATEKVPFVDAVNPAPSYEEVTNVHALGKLIYTDYFYAFQLSGIILLIAMVAAIVLTLRDKRFSKRQDVSKQVNRNHKKSIEIVHVESRKGVDV
jgi:NADH-quinone oxidoreductase subunit J